MMTIICTREVYPNAESTFKVATIILYLPQCQDIALVILQASIVWVILEHWSLA